MEFLLLNFMEGILLILNPLSAINFQNNASEIKNSYKWIYL